VSGGAPERDRPTVLVITGPTASGKTEVALALAAHHPVALISMDSAQVYRGLDIGTAKLPAALLERYPHALVDIRDPAEPYSAADFVADADAAIRAALAAGRLPVLVGGTMLYLRAFREGLADLPTADPAVRADIAEQAAQRGWPALHDDLRRLDPEAAAAIHPHNRSRIQRALEVIRITGEPLSAGWRRHGGRCAAERLGIELCEVAVVPDDRAALHRRIDARFRAMLDAGLVEEVIGLRARGDLTAELPSMRAVGYRQVWAYLDGHGDAATLAERGAAATRQLARRQLTWLRGWPRVTALPWADPQVLARQVAALALGDRSA
jgi:tRNA dimethylallyltransferase